MRKSNSFFDSLIVPEASNELHPETYFTKVNKYTCLRIMQDTNRVSGFLLATHENYGDELDFSINHYKSVNHQIGEIEYSIRKGFISDSESQGRITEVCRMSGLDLDHLISIVARLDTLDKQPNEKDASQLAQEIETKIRGEKEKRKYKEEEG